MKYLVGEHGAEAVITGRVAWVLEQRFGLEKIRLAVRGKDPDLDAQLEALHAAAARFRIRSADEPERTGTTSGAEPEPASGSNVSMSTSQVAARLGVEPRWALALVRQGRIRGEQQPNRRWRVDAESVAEYEESRR